MPFIVPKSRYRNPVMEGLRELERKAAKKAAPKPAPAPPPGKKAAPRRRQR